MSRSEFSKQTKRDAYERSGGKCEAVGTWYGLPEGQRCNMPLDRGVQYDHILTEHHTHDNSLENCAAVCPPCHRFKTDKHDTPMHSKADRQYDRNIGIKRSKRPFVKHIDPWGKKSGR